MQLNKYNPPLPQKLHVTIIPPGSVSLPHSGDVATTIQLYNIMKKYFDVYLCDFSGHSIFMPRWKYYTGIPKWLLHLTQQLAKKQDVLYVFNYQRIVVFAGFMRIFLHRNFKMVNHMVYPPPSLFVSKGIKQNFFKEMFFAVGKKFSDAIIYSPTPELISYIKSYQKMAVVLPPAIVDTDEMFFDKEARDNVRKSLTVENKPVVGLIGPFHKGNLPSLIWLKNNLGKFSKNIVFLVIGQCNQTDVFMHPNVIFVGHASAKFRDYLSVCDCVLVPRIRTNSQPMADHCYPMNKVLNSMSAGLTVITNDTGMSVEGAISPPIIIGKLYELPGLVNELVTDKARLKEIGANARDFVLTRYSACAIEGELVSLIQKLPYSC